MGLIYGLCCSCPNIVAQSSAQNQALLESYVEEMLGSPANTELYHRYLNRQWDSGVDAAEAASLLCKAYWTKKYMNDHPEYFARDGYPDHMCFNSHFDQCAQSQSDDMIHCAYEIYDGYRDTVRLNTDRVFGSYIFLPTGRNPSSPSLPEFLFDLDPNNNEFLPVAYTHPEVMSDLSGQNWNSVELYEGEEDEVLGAALSTLTPNGNRSLRLNNAHDSYHINSARKRFYVDSCDQFLTFAYAMVMENPGHPDSFQPFMAFVLRDDSFNILERLTYVSDPSDTCFNTASVPGYSQILWQDWRCDFFDVRPYHGRTIWFEALAADCGYGAHFGYGYFGDLCDTCCTPALSMDIRIDTGLCRFDACLDASVGCAQDSSGCVGELPIELVNMVLEVRINGSIQLYPLLEGECLDISEILRQYQGEVIEVRLTADYEFNCELIPLASAWEVIAVPANLWDEDIDIFCYGVECIGHHNGHPTFEFSAMEPNDIGPGWVAIESSIQLVGANIQIDDFDSNDDYILDMDGYVIVTDPSLIGGGNLEIQGTMLVTNGVDVCPVNITFIICCGEAIACQHWDGFCDQLMEEIQDAPIYFQDFVGEDGTVYREVYMEIPLIYLQLDHCLINEYTIQPYLTTWSYPTPNNTTHTYAGTLPHVGYALVTVFATVNEWENDPVLWLYISNNCGQYCIVDVSDFDFSGGETGPPHGGRLGSSEPTQDEWLEVFPNPAVDLLNVMVKRRLTMEAAITMYNSSGQLVWQSKIPKEQSSIAIDVSDFAAGVYLMQVQLEDEIVIKQVVVH